MCTRSISGSHQAKTHYLSTTELAGTNDTEVRPYHECEVARSQVDEPM